MIDQANTTKTKQNQTGWSISVLWSVVGGGGGEPRGDEPAPLHSCSTSPPLIIHRLRRPVVSHLCSSRIRGPRARRARGLVAPCSPDWQSWHGEGGALNNT